MSLLKLDKTPQEHSREQIESQLRTVFSTIQSLGENIARVVWENAYGLTPQEVMDVLGTDGGDLDGLLVSLFDVYNAAVPKPAELAGWIPEDKQLSTDAEGNVTISDK